MKNLTVWTFHPVARNTLVFVGLALFFLVLQRSLQSSLPFLNIVFIKRALLEDWFIYLAALPAGWSLARHLSWSRYAFGFFCFLVTFRTLEGLFLDFNKVLMLVLFIFVCMAYAFYQLLGWTFSRATFSPNYTADALSPPMAHRVHLVLQGDGYRAEGYLTNWDQEGAFVYLKEPWPKACRRIELELVIEGHLFGAKGSVLTRTWDERGIGLEWLHEPLADRLSWHQLMGLFDDLGWRPYLLR